MIAVALVRVRHMTVTAFHGRSVGSGSAMLRCRIGQGCVRCNVGVERENVVGIVGVVQGYQSPVCAVAVGVVALPSRPFLDVGSPVLRAGAAPSNR